MTGIVALHREPDAGRDELRDHQPDRVREVAGLRLPFVGLPVSSIRCRGGYERYIWPGAIPRFLTISMRSGPDSKRLPAGSASYLLPDLNT